MANYYLDIETTGLSPNTDKIITIQYQELHRNTGKPLGPLKILKEWECSEKDILKNFIADTHITHPYPFTFIPTGYNLCFEHNFLRTRSVLHGLPEIDVLDRPFLDLHACGVIMNKGEFKGSGLDKITGKPHNGAIIPTWYQNREYDKIVHYVEVEAREFIQFSAWLYQELPECLARFKGKGSPALG